MSTPNPNAEAQQVETEAPVTSDEATEQTPNPEGQEPEGDAQEADEDALPEWASKELRKTRDEAAARRTQVRDLEAKLAEAKSPEEFEAAVKEYQGQVQALERKLALASINLPDDLLALLEDVPTEELSARAEVLQKYAPKEEEPAPTKGLNDLSGGLRPNDPEKGEPSGAEVARSLLKRRF